MKDKERTILCMLIATVFLIPIIGNTAVAATTNYCFSKYDLMNAWETNPQYMVDGDENTSASTKINGDVQVVYDPVTNGPGPGTITKVEFRARGNFSGDCYAWIILCPIFRLGDGDDRNWTLNTTPEWSQWYDITDDTNAPDPWTVNDIANLKIRLTAGMPICPGRVITIYCSKVELRVTSTL